MYFVILNSNFAKGIVFLFFGGKKKIEKKGKIFERRPRVTWRVGFLPIKYSTNMFLKISLDFFKIEIRMCLIYPIKLLYYQSQVVAVGDNRWSRTAARPAMNRKTSGRKRESIASGMKTNRYWMNFRNFSFKF